MTFLPAYGFGLVLVRSALLYTRFRDSELQLADLEREWSAARLAALLAAFALTGFANFSSVGIQIGGIGAIAPERRHDLARLGLRALFVGFVATLLNAAIAGVSGSSANPYLVVSSAGAHAAATGSASVASGGRTRGQIIIPWKIGGRRDDNHRNFFNNRGHRSR